MVTPAEIFHASYSLLPEEKAELARLWQDEKMILRNQALVEAGEVEKHLWFVLEGSFVILFENESVSACVGLGYSGTLLCSFPSFFSQRPSRFRIVALKKSKVVGIRHHHFQDLLEKYPGLLNAWKGLLEQAVTGLIEREVQYLNSTPAERLRSLFSRNPHLFQLFPQKYLASYLKIDQATLSRLKSSLLVNLDSDQKSRN